MSRIDALIEDLCSDGVPFKSLDDVIVLRFGTRITKTKDSGTVYPVYGGGGESFRTDNYNREDDYVISRFAMSETCVRKVSGKFWMLDSGFTFDVRGTDILKDFVAYWLFNRQADIYACSSQGAQKNLRTEEFRKFRIPVPPIEVQREIVRILDTFSALETELEAELEARRVQYAHYREEMISGAAAFPRVRMDKCGELFRGKRFVKDDILDAGHPCIHYGEIYTKYGVAASESFSYLDVEQAKRLRKARPGDVVIATAGETIEDIGTAVAWMGKQEVVVHDACYVYRSGLNPIFVSHFLRTFDFKSQARSLISSSKISSISVANMGRIEIPAPAREVQDQIVEVLQKYEALTNDLSIGIPAELAARRRQYEHYRDRLLTFEERV